MSKKQNKIALDLEFEQPKTNQQTPDSCLDEARIIQAGWVIFDSNTGEHLKTRKMYINIGVPLSAFIKKLTNISDEEISTGGTILDVINALIEDKKFYGCDSAIIQWGNGDVEALIREAKINRKSSFIPGLNQKWPFGFSGKNAKHLYQFYAEANGLNPGGGLSKCVAKLGLKWQGQGKHDALIDAANTANLYFKILTLMRGATPNYLNSSKIKQYKIYPSISDFPTGEIIYGIMAPYVGIGTYTINRQFSWPDRSGTSKKEYDSWVKWICDQGYIVPTEYLNAYFIDK